MPSRRLQIENLRPNSWLVAIADHNGEARYKVGHLEKMEIGWSWTLYDDTTDYPPSGRFDGTSLDDAVMALMNRNRQELLSEVEIAQERLTDWDQACKEIQYRTTSEPWSFPKPNEV